MWKPSTVLIPKETGGRRASSRSALRDLLHPLLLHLCLGGQVHPDHRWVLLGGGIQLCSFSLASTAIGCQSCACEHLASSTFCQPAPCPTSNFTSSLSVRLFPPRARLLLRRLCRSPPPHPRPPCRHPCRPHPPRVPRHHWVPQSRERPHRLLWEWGWGGGRGEGKGRE